REVEVVRLGQARVPLLVSVRVAGHAHGGLVVVSERAGEGEVRGHGGTGGEGDREQLPRGAHAVLARGAGLRARTPIGQAHIAAYPLPLDAESGGGVGR